MPVDALVASEVARLTMLGARVLVDPHPFEGLTPGGLVKPDTAHLSYSQRGTVIAVGPKVASVQPGDVVLHGRWAHVAVDLDGREYLIFNETDLMGAIREHDADQS